MHELSHHLDLVDDVNDELDLFVEELPEQMMYSGNCIGTISSFSCAPTAATMSTMGTVISTGD